MKIAKLTFLLVFIALISFSIWAMYPKVRILVLKHTIFQPYYNYNPKKEVVPLVDTSKMQPAKAVPVLMYHGITEVQDMENTTLRSFISQMESLKEQGYTTITLDELNRFIDNKATLPPKPIVITFDDGRKDSYYPTDSLLKKLGFNVVLFMVTGKADEYNNFYLNWDELRKIKDLKYWDIQAHGRYSHNKIFIDDKGDKGYYLTSKEYKFEHLESDEVYKNRIVKDYLDCIQDLKYHLGINAKYYAIPFNDYEVKASSNYAPAYDLNTNILKKYFNLSFIQVNGGLGSTLTTMEENPYNFPGTDKTRIKRIEVKNMTGKELIAILDKYAPYEPNFVFENGKMDNMLTKATNKYGTWNIDKGNIVVKTNSSNTTARILMGQNYMTKYSIETEVTKTSGRSFSIIGYFKDNENYVNYGYTDNGLFIREVIKGETKDLVEPVVIENGINSEKHTLKITLIDNKLTAEFDNRVVFKDIKVSLSKGAAGLKIWGGEDIEGEFNISKFKFLTVR